MVGYPSRLIRAVAHIGQPRPIAMDERVYEALGALWDADVDQRMVIEEMESFLRGMIHPSWTYIDRITVG